MPGSTGTRRRPGCRPTSRPAEEQQGLFAALGCGRRYRGDRFEAINRASDWASFVAAVESFAVPSRNIVYADVDGNIGYAMSGRAAGASRRRRRHADRRQQRRRRWTGAIEPGSLPRVLNPPSGLIVSANNEIDRGFGGLDHARLGGAVPRLAAARCARRRPKASISTRWPRCRTIAAALPRTRPRRRRCRRSRWRTGTTPKPASRRCSNELADVGSRRRRTADRVAVRSVRRRPVAAHVCRRDGRAAVPEFYEWAGAERPAGLYAIIGDRQSRVVRRHRHGGEARDARRHLHAGRARRRRAAGRTSAAASRGAGWDRRPRGAVRASAGQHRLSVRAGSSTADRCRSTGDGTTVMRVSWNRLRRSPAWEYPSWRQISTSGNGTSRASPCRRGSQATR